MAEDLNTHPPEDQLPGEGVETLGSILTTARERQGLTIEQMAAELRVESRLLKALEEDRFEALPAPVFVKGYLRHLSNRFGLEYDDLLHRYTGQTDTRDAPVTHSEPIPEETRFLAPLLIGALVLVLGIPALWFTWVGRDMFSDIGSQEVEAPVPPPAQTEPVPEGAGTLADPGVAVDPAAQPSAFEPDSVPRPSSPESAPAEASAPDATGPGTAGAATSENELAINVAPGEETPLADEPPLADPAPVAADPADAPIPQGAASPGPDAFGIDVAGPAPPEDATPEDSLPASVAACATFAVEAGRTAGEAVQVTMRFDDDSWAEVCDGSGNSLYYNLGEAGTGADLEGTLPLSFMLGFSPGVRIFINGQPFAFPAPPGNDTVVRFVVAEAP